MEDQLHVKVSGTAVYKAVKNYLANSEEFKAVIDQTIKATLDKAFIERIAADILKKQINDHWQLKSVIENTVRGMASAKIREIVEAQIKDYLSKAVLVVPGARTNT